MKNSYDNCVYILERNENVIHYMFLYVDDILMENSNRVETNELKETWNGEFEMNNLGEIKRII